MFWKSSLDESVPEMFAAEEVNNICILLETGAKALSANKPLNESIAIQQTAKAHIDKIISLGPKQEPKKAE